MSVLGRLQNAACRHAGQRSSAIKVCPSFTLSAPLEARSIPKQKPSRGTDRPATPDPLLTLHAAVPARQARCLRNPLQAPAATLQASHTSISLPLGSVDLFGNYSVLGPAVIKKINNVLVALVQPGGSVSVLNSSSAGPTVMSCASLSHDEDASAVVNLSGQHLELDGSYELYDTDSDRTIQHDGKVIVSPATLSEDSCILLLPNGTLSHPVNVHPHDGHST